jgi:hypothetical protein
MSIIETLTPQNSAIVLIGWEPAMYQGVHSHDRLTPLRKYKWISVCNQRSLRPWRYVWKF